MNNQYLMIVGLCIINETITILKEVEMADNSKYDVVIIGAGISGLICASYLLRKGKKVLVLEQNHVAGGNITGFRRKGYYFDAGAQSSESVGMLFPILEELGLYKPEMWHRADWRIVTPDCDVKLDDFDQIRADFKKYFPESSEDLDKWFDVLSSGCMTFKKMMQDKPFPLTVRGKEKYKLLLDMGKEAVRFAPLAKDGITKTGTQFCREIFKDDKLAFLFGEFGNQNMLLFMFFSFWYCFPYDYWHPDGGLQNIADMIADDFQSRGGEIRFRTAVDRVICEGRCAKGVETDEGERFYADKIVNTGNLKRLVFEMCDPELFPYKYRQILKEAPVSFGMPTAFLGLDMSDEELNRYMKGHHTFYWRTYETITDVYTPDAHRRGFSQFSWTSMHDKSLAPEGKNSLVVQVFTNYHWRNGWGTGSDDPFARNEEYAKLKERVLEDIIADSEYIIPGLSKRVEVKELGTPRTLSRYTLNTEGAPMGWSYDRYKIFMFGKFGSFKTKVKNLYLAGHYSVWPGGIVFSALSGKIVADAMYEGVAKTLLT